MGICILRNFLGVGGRGVNYASPIATPYIRLCSKGWNKVHSSSVTSVISLHLWLYNTLNKIMCDCPQISDSSMCHKETDEKIGRYNHSPLIYYFHSLKYGFMGNKGQIESRISNLVEIFEK